jgi:hypothetical protein
LLDAPAAMVVTPHKGAEEHVMKTENLTNTLGSVAMRAALLAPTLAFGPVSPSLADGIPFMPPYSRRARRQIVDLLKLPGSPERRSRGNRLNSAIE